MSLAIGDPALEAIRCPSADQDGWETGGRSWVRRRTSPPSVFITNRASDPSRLDTKAIRPGAGGAGGCGVGSTGPVGGDVVQPSRRTPMAVTAGPPPPNPPPPLRMGRRGAPAQPPRL